MPEREETDLQAEVARLRSELELANRKLAESYKLAALGRLIASIAHEMNTPIGSIRSNNAVVLRSLEALEGILSGCLGSGAPEMGRAREILDVLRSLATVDKIACERISSVIPGLKAFARVEEHELRKADINEILRGTIALTYSGFRPRISFETEFGDLPQIECYPQSLYQVFLNVLINACQAIEAQGTVTVRTRLEGDRAHISITDTGRGIPPENVPKIFTLGFTTKPIGVGTGLGLVLSRQIVQRHGGAIEFETEVGKGTTFHIRLPVTQARAGESKLSQDGSPAGGAVESGPVCNCGPGGPEGV